MSAAAAAHPNHKPKQINIRFLFPGRKDASIQRAFSNEVHVRAVKNALLNEHWEEKQLGSKSGVRRLRFFHGGRELQDDASLEANGISSIEEFPTAVHVVISAEAEKNNKTNAKDPRVCCVS
eukprot:GHVP01042749.1.p1 GENE.GHVP01042749.1~~GHVP01042749.1.p1  ORF type:complete len:122 (-),score=15.79 GHVP01042749.1:198-563(-)